MMQSRNTMYIIYTLLCEKHALPINKKDTGWRRPIGSLIFIGHFPQKRPIIRGSSAKHDLQLKASYRAEHALLINEEYMYYMFCYIDYIYIIRTCTCDGMDECTIYIICTIVLNAYLHIYC